MMTVHIIEVYATPEISEWLIIRWKLNPTVMLYWLSLSPCNWEQDGGGIYTQVHALYNV